MSESLQEEASNKVSISLKDAKVKLDTYNRGRMKITIKLDKAQAEGYVNFKRTVLPEGASEEDFVRTVFFMGLEQFHTNAMNMVKKYVEENEEKLKAEGVDTDKVKQVTSEMIEASQKPQLVEENDDATND